MSATAVWAMVAICGFVWGGFLCLALHAWRREGVKERRRSHGDPR